MKRRRRDEKKRSQREVKKIKGKKKRRWKEEKKRRWRERRKEAKGKKGLRRNKMMDKIKTKKSTKQGIKRG